VQAIAPIAAEALVATVARQRHGHVPARELADPVRRDRRAVGVGLVVKRRELVDQIEIVGLHALDAVVRVIPIRDRLRELRFVERGIVEGDRAGVDGLGRKALPSARRPRENRRRRKERAERHLGDHPQLDRLAQPATSSSHASSSELHAPSVKRTSQYSRGAGTGWPRVMSSVCAGGSFLPP
jgi:hypothetical protein